MSILPEYILQQVLVRGIRAFRENGDYVDMLFRNLCQDDIDGIRKFIRDNTVDISLQFPAAPITLPSIVITLKNESESQGFLGELLQPPQAIRATGHPFPMEELIDPATVLGAGSIETVDGSTQTISKPFQAIGATANSISFTLQSPFNISDPFELNDIEIVIREGIGAGQRRQVQSITPNAATNSVIVRVSPNWTILPDSSSIFEFYTSSESIVGEPSKLFTSRSHLERTGSNYRVTYQLLISGPNAEMTLFLYAMVKAIMVINNTYLLQQGFINPRMSGTDFVAKPEYLPDLAYSRALVLEFDHSFDVYLELEALSKIKIDLGVYSPDITNSSGTELSVSLTEITLGD